MTKLDEIERTIECISKHVDILMIGYDKMVKDVYVIEENRETIRGKYFNLAYVIHEINYKEIARILIEHCCNNHT